MGAKHEGLGSKYTSFIDHTQTEADFNFLQQAVNKSGKLSKYKITVFPLSQVPVQWNCEQLKQRLNEET